MLALRLYITQSEPATMMNIIIKVKTKEVKFHRGLPSLPMCRKYTTCTRICTMASVARMQYIPVVENGFIVTEKYANKVRRMEIASPTK